MAGTFAEQATLATDNAFINKCRTAMLFQAMQLTTSATAQNVKTLAQMQSILQSAGGSAANLAWVVATGNSTIAAAAPVVPNDSDTQFAVNTILALL